MSKRKGEVNGKRTRGSFRVPMIAMIAATFTLVVGISMAFAAAGGKTPFNPWAGLTDQQKQAQVDAAHSANIKYLQDFEARGGDPRSLQVIRVSTWQPPSASLGTAASQATLILHGRVSSVHFVANLSGGMPQMNATVTTLDVGKGSAGSTIVVSQLGGPVAQPNGTGALVELEDEDLMLPGDEVLLLLSRASSGTGFQPIYGAGVQLILGGRLSGDSAARYGLDGTSYQIAWASLVDPNVSASAYPLRNSSQ